MKYLPFFLIRDQVPGLLLLTTGLSLCGGLTATLLLPNAAGGWRSQISRIALLAVLGSVFIWAISVRTHHADSRRGVRLRHISDRVYRHALRTGRHRRRTPGADVGVPFDLDGTMAHIGASIGISFFPDDGATNATPFKSADTALYRAKDHGRG